MKYARSGARRRRTGNDPPADERYNEADFDIVAAERGVPPARIAPAWLLDRPGVTAPVVGATKVAHVDDATAAADLELSEEETARPQAPYRPSSATAEPPSPHRGAGGATAVPVRLVQIAWSMNAVTPDRTSARFVSLNTSWRAPG